MTCWEKVKDFGLSNYTYFCLVNARAVTGPCCAITGPFDTLAIASFMCMAYCLNIIFKNMFGFHSSFSVNNDMGFRGRLAPTIQNITLSHFENGCDFNNLSLGLCMHAPVFQTYLFLFFSSAFSATENSAPISTLPTNVKVIVISHPFLKWKKVYLVFSFLHQTLYIPIYFLNIKMYCITFWKRPLSPELEH